MPGTVPPDPQDVTNVQLYVMIDRLQQQLLAANEKAALDRALFVKRIEDLTGEVAMARKETADMVDLWKSGKTVVWLMKLAGSIATAVLAVWGVIALVKGAAAAEIDLALGMLRRQG